jgi:hypothetical protein
VIDSAIARFRQREQALMRSTCTVVRVDPIDAGFYDSNAGTWVPVSTQMYAGPCLVRPARGLVGSEETRADDEVRIVRYVIKLLADAAVQKDDVVTVTSSPDPDLVGRAFRITDVLSDDWQINRRCAAEEVV